MATPFISQQSLENALGKNLVRAIYDDDGDNVVDVQPMADCLAYACTQVKSFLYNEYNFDLDTLSPVPDELRFAAVDFACAYTARRRPDIWQAQSERSWTDFRDAALDNIKMFAAGLARVAPSVEKPANVGGSTFADGPRMAISNSDGSRNSGDW